MTVQKRFHGCPGYKTTWGAFALVQLIMGTLDSQLRYIGWYLPFHNPSKQNNIPR